jgi:hypothetical protein
MCILIDTKHKALVNSKTNEKVYPACFDDLIQYHAYLLCSKHPEQAQQKLKAVFKGEKVISDMVTHARGDK